MTQSQDFRFLHVMLRVLDLDKSIEFYTSLLGMKLLRRKDYKEGKFTLTFLGYGNESDTTVLELTHNWDQTDPYDIGEGFGHLALGIKDIYQTCETLETMGAKIIRPPGPMTHGTTIMAFIEDPDGYKIELIQKN